MARARSWIFPLPLRVINKAFRAPVDNGLFTQGIVEREVFEDPRTREMLIATGMSLVELGPIQMLTVPGELLPELAVGGYDDSRINAPRAPLVDPNNRNPPKLDQAPEGPYIKDRMPGLYPWLQDERSDGPGQSHGHAMADCRPHRSP